MLRQFQYKILLFTGLLALSFLICFSSLNAQDDEATTDYIRALNEGHYDDAVTLGLKNGSSNGLAIAARATLIKAQFFTSEKLERLALIAEALKFAKEASRLTPNHIEGLLQQSVAIGFRGRLLTAGKDARASKEHLQRVLILDLENPWGLAGMGAWHGEVVIKAGSFFGNIFYGAKTKHMRRFFTQALENDPNNIAIRVGFVQVLLRLGGKKNRVEAVNQLTIIQGQKPINHLEKILYDQGMVLLPLAKTNKKKALKAYLKIIR